MENFKNYKKILITGASGFIGSHLVEKVAREGAGVRAFVHYNSRGDIGLLQQIDPMLIKEIEIFPGDLRDPNTVARAVKNIQAVVHLGALISIPYSYLNPREVIETNIMGTLNVLQACMNYGVEKFIHTSTSEVYGTAKFVPINERHPLQGQSPYAASKIGADKLVESYYCSFGLPALTIRPFNTFGPRQSARAVLPVIITQALAGQPVKLGNTTAKRDFTYISDTVEAYIKALLSENLHGEVINLGTGREVSIAEVCEIVSRLTGKEITIQQESRRFRPEKSEVMQLLSDNSRAKELLGWMPKVEFEEGLQRTIDWIANNLNRYQVGNYEF